MEVYYIWGTKIVWHLIFTYMKLRYYFLVCHDLFIHLLDSSIGNIPTGSANLSRPYMAWSRVAVAGIRNYCWPSQVHPLWCQPGHLLQAHLWWWSYYCCSSCWWLHNCGHIDHNDYQVQVKHEEVDWGDRPGGFALVVGYWDHEELRGMYHFDEPVLIHQLIIH